MQVRLSYERAKQRHLTTHKNKQATTKEQIVDCSQFSLEASEETRTLVTLLKSVSARFNDTDEYDNLLGYGKSYDWSSMDELVSECNKKIQEKN